MPITPLLARIAQLEALERAATLGPWELGHPGESYTGIDSDAKPNDWVVSPCDDYETPKLNDAQFIAESRNSLPGLLKSLRVLVGLADGAGRYKEDSTGRILFAGDVLTEAAKALGFNPWNGGKDICPTHQCRKYECLCDVGEGKGGET